MQRARPRCCARLYFATAFEQARGGALGAGGGLEVAGSGSPFAGVVSSESAAPAGFGGFRVALARSAPGSSRALGRAVVRVCLSVRLRFVGWEGCV